jgi:hypothetical protein
MTWEVEFTDEFERWWEGDYRVLYAFDPRRVAILLIGGIKTGNNRWYEQFVPVADRLYDEHLIELSNEGLI